jgi:hypothetical protein
LKSTKKSAPLEGERNKRATISGVFTKTRH